MTQLPKIGSFPFHIESYVCDFTGHATLPVLSSFLLDAASNHAQQRGFGYEEISRDGVAWVLSRLAIEIDRYPVSNDNITVETWIENVERFFTQRCFRFVASDGLIFGNARSVWAAINVETRRPIDIRIWRPDLADYIETDRKSPIGKMEKIHPVVDVEPAMGYTVRYSDIDINRHMNSMKYIEHVVNVFDIQMFKDKTIRKFEIVYLLEGAFGDKMKLLKKDVSDTECLVDTKRGEESVCRSRILWTVK
jgi:acyl-ACP thioesterase